MREAVVGAHTLSVHGGGDWPFDVFAAQKYGGVLINVLVI
jgi:hypothetical protein